MTTFPAAYGDDAAHFKRLVRIAEAEMIAEAVHHAVSAANRCGASDGAQAIATALIERIKRGVSPASAEPAASDPGPYVPHVDRDVLMRGDELRDGMVVRLLSPFGSTPTGWVTVSRIRVSPPSQTRGWSGAMLGLPPGVLSSASYDMAAQVSFAATAEDGVLSTWDGAVSHWWIVRKDSLPNTPQADGDVQCRMAEVEDFIDRRPEQHGFTRAPRTTT